MKKSILVLFLIAAAAACITFLALGGTLGWGGDGEDGDRSGEVLKTEQDFRDRLAALRIDRDKLARGIQRLENKKQETLDFLVNEKGISSSEDITDGDSDVRYALRQLKGWKEEIEARKKDLPKYDEAISSLEAMLAEIERKRIQEEVALSEDDYIELRKIVVDLNERLGMDHADPFEDEELYNLFDEEVSSLADGEESAETGNGD